MGRGEAQRVGRGGSGLAYTALPLTTIRAWGVEEFHGNWVHKGRLDMGTRTPHPSTDHRAQLDQSRPRHPWQSVGDWHRL